MFPYKRRCLPNKRSTTIARAARAASAAALLLNTTINKSVKLKWSRDIDLQQALACDTWSVLTCAIVHHIVGAYNERLCAICTIEVCTVSTHKRVTYAPPNKRAANIHTNRLRRLARSPWKVYITHSPKWGCVAPPLVHAHQLLPLHTQARAHLPYHHIIWCM